MKPSYSTCPTRPTSSTLVRVRAWPAAILGRSLTGRPAAVDQLRSSGSLDRIGTLVLTHLGPKRLVTLQALLSARSAGAGQVQVYLSNPAFQLVRSKLGAPLRSGRLQLPACPAQAGAALGAHVL